MNVTENFPKTFTVIFALKVPEYNNNLTIFIQMEFLLKRCKNKDNLDSCETWSPIRTNEACPVLLADNQPWSKFIQSIKPQLSCPFKKVRNICLHYSTCIFKCISFQGLYHVNGTIQFTTPSYLIPLPIDENFWNVNIRILIKKKTSASICLMAFLKKYKI